MADTEGKRRWFVNLSRDILVISAVLSLLGTVLLRVSSPYWEPFRDLPDAMADLAREVAVVRAQIDTSKPQLIDFLGKGMLTNGTSFGRHKNPEVLYYLHRHASCDTMIQVSFYNVDTGTTFQGERRRSVKAPVTSHPILFKIRIAIPEDLPAGRYTYAPAIIPIDCGVYETLYPPFSQIFEVAS